MSRLGSLYIRYGEPEGELSGGDCEVCGWAAGKIESLECDITLLRLLIAIAVAEMQARCAKVCDNMDNFHDSMIRDLALQDCAAAIRALDKEK